MKKFLLAFCSVCVVFVVALYLAFLFYLPKKISLVQYKELVQNLAKEQAMLNVDYDDLSVITAPDLSVGVQLKNLSVKLPDGSLLLGVDGVKGRLFLPSLFTLTAKLSCLEVQSPRVNLDIKDGKQYKLVLLIEQILNDPNRKQKDLAVKSEVEEETKNVSWFNPEWIKIKVPNARILDYKVKVDDSKSGHYLQLSGDELNIAYKTTGAMTKQKVRVKTHASVFSDESENITANIDFATILPKFESTKDTEDDPAEKVEIPFVNPVLAYRTYDFKTNIDSKMRVKTDKKGRFVSKGHFDADNISMNVKGLTLPTGYIKLNTDNTKANVLADFYVAQNQNIKLMSEVDYGENTYLNVDAITDKIYFNDLILLAKGILDTMQIKHELNNFKANGYLQANTGFRTDFKKLKSEGSIIARDGALSNSKVGLVISKINANLIFDNDTFKIRDTYAKINNSVVNLEGSIDNNSNVELKVNSDILPLPQLYRAFAPQKVIRAFNIASGNLKLNVDINGKIESALASAKVFLTNFRCNDKNNNFVLADEKLGIAFMSDFKTFDGLISNKNMSITLPQTSSVIRNPELTVLADPNKIVVKDSKLNINKSSVIDFKATVEDYIKTQKADFFADGKLVADDMVQFLGKQAKPFIDAKGTIPMKVSVNGNKKRQEIIAQLFADANDYISPITFDALKGKQSVLQSRILYKGNRLNIRDTGLFVYPNSMLISNDLTANMYGQTPLILTEGTVVSLDTPNPFINMITVKIPETLHTSIYTFKNSGLDLSGNLLAFGQLASPTLRGHFNADNISIPDLFLTMAKSGVQFDGRELKFLLDRLVLNKNDFRIRGTVELNRLPEFYIRQLNLVSNRVNLEDLMQVVDSAMKFVPPADNTKNANSAKVANADIPVTLRNGNYIIRNAQTGNIVATNTNGRVEFLKNVLYLNNLKTNVFKGAVEGDISVDVLNMLIKLSMSGADMDVETLFLQACNMKDALSGTLSFKTDLELGGTTMEEQMKSLKGGLTFLITDGQFGPFGKFENFLLAENIRESEFFKNSIGGIVSSMLTIDTTHYKTLDGYLEFADGVVNINPITSLGNVMSLHIAGQFDLLKNTADMKVRGRLGSMVSNVLGPLAQLNPINVVKATPGVDYLMLKAFSFFCEEITQQEMDAIPSFEKGYDNSAATKFQVVLRGDVASPLKLVKSFKWLAVTSDMEKAKNFMETLPPPTLDANGNYVLSDPEVIAQQEKEAKTIKGKVKNFFANLKKDENKTEVPVIVE